MMWLSKYFEFGIDLQHVPVFFKHWTYVGNNSLINNSNEVNLFREHRQKILNFFCSIWLLTFVLSPSSFLVAWSYEILLIYTNNTNNNRIWSCYFQIFIIYIVYTKLLSCITLCGWVFAYAQVQLCWNLKVESIPLFWIIYK